MRLIPVLDVMNGVVVRGIGGRRSEYRPIVSRLTTSTNPVEVARALIDACRPREVYLADLDAIRGAAPAIDTYKQILSLGVDLWVDAGIRDVESARFIAETGCHVVAGLETVPNLDCLRQIVEAIGADRVVFSLDLRKGIPLRDWSATEGAIGIAARATGCGITRLIVLDLARVGSGMGTGTDALCREMAFAFPHVEVIAGGGVSGADDLMRLGECGVQGVLVASALHDRRLPVHSPPSPVFDPRY